MTTMYRVVRLSLAPLIPVTFALAAATLSLSACHHAASESAADSTAAQQMVIGTENIAIATQGVVTNGPTISGTLTPALQATIRAQVSGSGRLDKRRCGANCRAWTAVRTVGCVGDS